MNIFCRLFGHTWTHRTENQKVSWNAGKDQAQLHITSDAEPRFWLECQRCGERNESPTRDQVRRINN